MNDQFSAPDNGPKNFAWMFLPIAVAPARMMIEMPVAMIPYSIETSARSSRKKIFQNATHQQHEHLSAPR